MNQQRQLKKAKLGDMQKRRESVRLRGLTLCRVIAPLIDPDLTELHEMNIADAANAMDELIMQQAELTRLDTKIADLEEALYG